MAVVVTYSYPVSGATAPTAAQVNGNKPQNVVSGTVSMGDTDTFATITHNFGAFPSGQGEGTTEASKNFPIPILNALAWGTGTSTVVPQFSIARPNATQLTLAKQSATNSGGTFEFTLLRPHTLTR